PERLAGRQSVQDLVDEPVAAVGEHGLALRAGRQVGRVASALGEQGLDDLEALLEVAHALLGDAGGERVDDERVARAARFTRSGRADRDREVRPVGALLERDLACGAVAGEVDLGVVLFLLLVRHRVAVLAVERLIPRVVSLIEDAVHVARDLGGRTFLLLAREGDPARRGKLGRELRRAGHRPTRRAALPRLTVP